MLRKRARERRRLEEIREAGPEQQNVSNGSQFMKKMVELQATMEESFTDDQKLAFEFGSEGLPRIGKRAEGHGRSEHE